MTYWQILRRKPGGTYQRVDVFEGPTLESVHENREDVAA